MIEHEHLDLEVKVGEVDDSGTFEGVASVFGATDLVGDTVAPGAFSKSLDAHRRAGRLPLLLWAHDLAQPIGRWLDIRETAEGLLVKGRLLLDTAKGREAYAMLREKVVDGLSIGFRTVRSARTKTGRLLQELDLAEISLVSLPALPAARVHSVKSQPRREPAHPMKDNPDMPIDIALPDTPDEAPSELPPEVRDQLAALETKIAERDVRLDKIETRLSRPGARIETRDDPQAETKAFASWCRKGWDGLGDIEKKVLVAGTGGSPDPSGWQTIPEQFLAELIRNLVLFSPMRSVARVQTVSGGPVLVPKRTSNLTAAWVAETVEHAVSEPAYTQLSVGLFEARVTTEVSNQLLEDSAFDIGAELARDFGEEFARLEGLAFVRGNGTTEPAGWGASDFPTNPGGTLDADDLIDLYHDVPSVYAANGTWLMNRANMGNARKLKATGTGNYLWTESLQPGDPPSLLGRPVVEIPDLTESGSPAAETVVAFGDWSRAFRIFDRVGLEVLRDPYTLARRSIVAFHARKRVGSALVNAEAVRGLTIAS